MQGVPHYFLNFLDPRENFPVAKFKDKAEKKISEIFSRKKIPFLVGGSGLFIDAVLDGFLIPKISPNTEFRKKLEKFSSEQLFRKLQKISPEIAKKINQKNKRQIIRKLEILEKLPAKKIFQKKKQFDEMRIIIWTDPQKLAERIEKRTEQMWKNGFLQEVKMVIEKFGKNCPAMISHGYPEAVSFLEGKISENEAKKLMIRNTRRYAKRQRTWWRRHQDAFWVSL